MVFLKPYDGCLTKICLYIWRTFCSWLCDIE